MDGMVWMGDSCMPAQIFSGCVVSDKDLIGRLLEFRNDLNMYQMWRSIYMIRSRCITSPQSWMSWPLYRTSHVRHIYTKRSLKK